jgi:hypothetical protein
VPGPQAIESPCVDCMLLFCQVRITLHVSASGASLED